MQSPLGVIELLSLTRNRQSLSMAPDMTVQREKFTNTSLGD
jgi:hypothetical protein